MDAAGHRLARLLQLNKHAHELHLKDQQLGALAAKALAFALKSNRTITMLSLDKRRGGCAEVRPPAEAGLQHTAYSGQHTSHSHQ